MPRYIPKGNPAIWRDKEKRHLIKTILHCNPKLAVAALQRLSITELVLIYQNLHRY